MSPSSENSDPRVVNIDGRDRRPWALQTRDNILNAAVEEIAERGFERARLVDIAKRAGVTVGSIYTWYRDKADLFIAALDHAIEAQRERNQVVINYLQNSDDGGWLWRIAAMVPRSGIDTEPSATQRLLIEALHTAWQNEEARETILPRLSSLLAQYRQVIQDARKAGEISPHFNPELVARLFMALHIGMGALDLAGVERPNDRHWMPVFDALRDVMKSPQQS
jgi:AcrR family transcriptional regulator